MEDFWQGQVAIVLLVLPREQYHERLRDVVSAVAARSEKVCYVTLNRSYAKVREEISAAGGAVGQFFFLDTATPFGSRAPEDCILVGDAHALTELGLAVTSAIEERGCSIALFDAVSTLQVYHPANVVLMFVHATITKLRGHGTKGLLIMVPEQRDSPLVKDVAMFSDRVMDFTVG